MNYKMMGRFVARIVLLEAVFLLPALLISFGYAETGAVQAFLFGAVASVVAHAKVGPFVVKRPDNALSAAHDFAHFIERNHALVNPMQVYDVGFLELRCGGDADAGVGDVCLPES